MVVLLGVPRVWVFLYGGFFAHCVVSHERYRRCHVQKCCVFVYIWGVGTARWFFIATNVCGLTNIYNIIYYFSFPTGSPRHFPLGAFPNPTLILLPPMVLLQVAPLLWSGLFLALGQFELLWTFLNLYPHVEQYTSGSHQGGHTSLFSVVLVLFMG